MKNTVKKLLVLWLICWIIYCGSEFLLYLLIYRGTMPHERDYSVLCGTQHAVFAFFYSRIFSASEVPAAPFRFPQALLDFFRRNWQQLLLLIACAGLYEGIRAAFPDSNNLISALLLLFFPSAALCSVPFLRTVIGLSVSLFSLLLTDLGVRYGRYLREKRQKNSPGD